MAKALNQRQAIFAVAHGSGMSLEKAAIHAGFAPKSARVRAGKLMKMPHVAEAVEAERAKAVAELRIAGAYDAKKAMEELDAAIEFAKSTRNATAYTRAIELKAKLMGLMIEKKEGAVAGFQLVINGIDTPLKDVPNV